MTLAENTEVANLRAIAGEYDIQERHMGLAKLPVFLENAKKGNYTVHLDPGLNGSDAAIHIGNSYEGDPEIAKLLRNKDFRHALALGIDRDQLNEAFWLGVGSPGIGRAVARHASTARAPNGTRSGASSTSSRPTSCSTRSASPRRTPTGIACAPTARDGCASKWSPSAGSSSRTRRSARWSSSSGRRSASTSTSRSSSAISPSRGTTTTRTR